jgi:hypothetical protein
MEDAVAKDAVACSRNLVFADINTMKGGDVCIVVVSSNVHSTCIETTNGLAYFVGIFLIKVAVSDCFASEH